MTGGDVRQINAVHPELGSAVYKHKSEGNNTIDVGGRTTKSDSTLIAADGTVVYQIANKRGVSSFELVLKNSDYQHLKETSASLEPTVYTIVYQDNTTVTYIGKPVDLGEFNLNNRTMTVNFEFKPVNLV